MNVHHSFDQESLSNRDTTAVSQPFLALCRSYAYTIAVDPGIVVNPFQLKRQVEGGALMGISHALYDATGNVLRRLPLKRPYVQELLKP